MPKYKVELYELHVQTVEIEAENDGDAIARVLDGEGYYYDNTFEYMETATKYHGDLALTILGANTLSELGHDMLPNGRGVPGIRSVEEIDD